MKAPTYTFITILVLGILIGTINIGTVKAVTNVSGIITTDTTWTKANSPYTLTEVLTVSQGATLTIEAGSTVNLQTYPLQVNGTLIAIGSNEDPIYFNGIIESENRGAVMFRPSSNAWNETTSSGCIIENSIFNTTVLDLQSSVKINNNTINSEIYPYGSPLIMYASGSPTITNNTIAAIISAYDQTVIANNTINGKIEALNSAIIANNTIKRVSIFSPYDIVLTASDTSLIADNYLKGKVRILGSPTISNNVIDGELDVTPGSSPLLLNNTVSDLPISSPDASPEPTQTPDQSFFFVESNSTVSELFFNSTGSELSFSVSGPSDTSGFVKVTIAKSLVLSVQNVKVYLDGEELEVRITSDEDSWLLSFNYMHSAHQVRISLAADEVAQSFLGLEFWIGVGIVIIIVSICTVLLLYNRKSKRI